VIANYIFALQGEPLNAQKLFNGLLTLINDPVKILLQHRHSCLGSSAAGDSKHGNRYLLQRKEQFLHQLYHN